MFSTRGGVPAIREESSFLDKRVIGVCIGGDWLLLFCLWQAA